MVAEARPAQAGLCLSEWQFRRHVRLHNPDRRPVQSENLDLERNFQIPSWIPVCSTLLEDDDVQKLFHNDPEKYPQTHAPFGHQHRGALYWDGRLPSYFPVGPG